MALNPSFLTSARRIFHGYGLGLAKQLAELNIPQVIVMRELVPNAAAQTFLKQFLTSFSKGISLYLAVRQARESLKDCDREAPGANWLPVICQNPAQASATWPQVYSQKTLPPPPSDWAIKVLDRETWQPLLTLEGHTDEVRSVAISPNGLLIASGSVWE